MKYFNSDLASTNKDFLEWQQDMSPGGEPATCITGSEAVLLDAAMQDEASDGLWYKGPNGRYSIRLRAQKAIAVAAKARGK